MAWKQISSPKSVLCTRKLVQEFYDMEPCPDDRPYTSKRAAVIKGAIIKGTFRVADFASVYCRATKKTYRVNGKHTAIVLADLNGKFPAGLHAMVERYEADGLEDVAEIYATFDHRRSSRSPSEINRVFAGSSPELAEIPRRIANTAVSGMSFAIWEQDSIRHEADERAKLLLEHREFVVWVAAIISKSPHLMRASVVAAMFRTYQRTKKAATEFWQQVTDENHASNKHPTRVLARWLLTHDVYAGAHHTGRQQLDSPRGMFIRCLVAWNAWRQGRESVELIYNPESKTPTVS